MADEHMLIAWSRRRFADQMARGRAFDDIRREYVASPLLCSLYTAMGLCCTNPMRDSSCESSVVAGLHEQTHISRLQDQELARIQ